MDFSGIEALSFVVQSGLCCLHSWKNIFYQIVFIFSFDIRYIIFPVHFGRYFMFYWKSGKKSSIALYFHIAILIKVLIMFSLIIYKWTPFLIGSIKSITLKRMERLLLRFFLMDFLNEALIRSRVTLVIAIRWITIALKAYFLWELHWDL